jgi:hypothetical protein
MNDKSFSAAVSKISEATDDKPSLLRSAKAWPFLLSSYLTFCPGKLYQDLPAFVV